MALSHSSKIPTSGLVACLDAANPKSYPGTGTTWTDITGNGNNGTMTGVTFETEGGGCMETTGVTGSHIDISGIVLTTGTSTIVCGSRYTTGSNGRVVCGLNNNWLLGHWSTYVDRYYALGWVNQPTATSEAWRIYAGTADVTGNKYSLYLNGVNEVLDSTGGTAGPNGIRVGKSHSDTEFSDARTSFILAYDRVLTADEVLQIHNSYRGRFGI